MKIKKPLDHSNGLVYIKPFGLLKYELRFYVSYPAKKSMFFYKNRESHSGDCIGAIEMASFAIFPYCG